MNKKSVFAFMLGITISWFGGYSMAKSATPECDVCPDIIELEVCPDVYIPPCPDCILTCPEAQEKECVEKECIEPIKIRIRAISRPHLMRFELGSHTALVGYTWNRNGRIKPSMSVIYDEKNSVLISPKWDYYDTTDVTMRDNVTLTGGVTIGLGKRHGITRIIRAD